MPVRAPWTWMGATPHLGMPRSVPGRKGRTAPSSPALRGRSHPAVPRGKATASRDGARPGLARRCRAARRPASRPTDPPPPRSGARHPSGTDRWCASDPKGVGAGVRKHTRPRTRTRPSDWGVATVTAGAARAAPADLPAQANDVGAPADTRRFPCASPKRRSAHRTPASFARSSTALSRSAGATVQSPPPASSTSCPMLPPCSAHTWGCHAGLQAETAFPSRLGRRRASRTRNGWSPAPYGITGNRVFVGRGCQPRSHPVLLADSLGAIRGPRKPSTQLPPRPGRSGGFADRAGCVAVHRPAPPGHQATEPAPGPARAPSTAGASFRHRSPAALAPASGVRARLPRPDPVGRRIGLAVSGSFASVSLGARRNRRLSSR